MVHINTYILFFCLLHTYDKQYNVTRSSRYGILENFHYPLLQLLFDVLFRHISSTSCICVAIRESFEKEKKKEKKKNRKKDDRRQTERITIQAREFLVFLSLSIGEGLSRVPPHARLIEERKSRNWRLGRAWSSNNKQSDEKRASFARAVVISS